MASGIYIPVSGAVAQSQALETTANNIANGATPGYRTGKLAFGEVLATTQSTDSHFAGITSAAIDKTPGAIRQTNNPLDLAIVGDGLFAVEAPNGTRYTRAGNFQINGEGVMVHSSGYPVLTEKGGEIRVPEGTGFISVGDDGTVLGDDSELGKIQIAAFDPKTLVREGNNLFAAAQEPAAVEEPQVISGAVEMSNVNVVREMVGLVKMQRTYEALVKMIESYRALDSKTANGLGRPR